MPMFSVVLKVYTIVAILQHVSCNPLVEFIPSLCCNTCHWGVMATKINLKPLIDIVCTCWPCTLFCSTLLKIQLALDGSMIGIPLWRGTDLSVSYASIFHAQRFFANWKVVNWMLRLSLMANWSVFILSRVYLFKGSICNYWKWFFGKATVFPQMSRHAYQFLPRSLKSGIVISSTPKI